MLPAGVGETVGDDLAHRLGVCAGSFRLTSPLYQMLTRW